MLLRSPRLLLPDGLLKKEVSVTKTLSLETLWKPFKIKPVQALS